VRRRERATRPSLRPSAPLLPLRPSVALLLAAALALAAVGCARGGDAGARAAGGDGGPGSGNAGNVEGARGANLLLVTLDTVRADHLGCYGYGPAETPALDRLAREGVRFARASSAAPLTLPSHASILTGLLPLHHGVRNNGAAGLAAGTPTLATLLGAAGYRTGAFVAAFVLDHRFGLAPGFETYDDEVNRDPNAGWVLEAERAGDQVVDRALAWLGRLGQLGRLGKDDSRPFFLWVHLYDAHAPYRPPSPYRERHAGRPYDGAIAFDDAQVGRLLAEIDRRGWRERTVVAVTADHGESLGEHGEATHGLLLYEPDLAVPLLLRGPGLAPRVVQTPVGLVDLAPTLAGMVRPAGSAATGENHGSRAGSAATGGSSSPAAPLATWAQRGPGDGRDLSAALRERREPPPADLYAETRYPEVFGWTPLAALRRRDLKYIAAGDGTGGSRSGGTPTLRELYDLAADPREAINLAGSTAAPAAPAAPAAFDRGGRDALLRGFAAQLAAIEASTLRRHPLPGSAPPRTVSPGEPAPGQPSGPPPDAETRARLASLGYVAPGASASSRAGASSGQAPAFGGSAAAAARRPGPEPRRQVELFQRFERAHQEELAGQTGAALADLEAVVAADPPNPVFRAELAKTLRERGRLDRAIPLYRRAAADAPEDPEAWYNLAAALEEAGQLREARAAIERALRLDPGRPEAHNTLGIVLLAEHRPEDARHEFAVAVAADPRNAHAWNNLGNVERALGRAAAAEQAYRRALALAPDYPEALNGLGALEVERDRPAAALPLFERALARAPGYQEVRLNRAIALQMAGNAAAAVAAYRDFLRATDPQPRLFAEQRQAARHFLDQLSRASAAPPGKQPAGGG
jgi:choline-sulfatase